MRDKATARSVGIFLSVIFILMTIYYYISSDFYLERTMIHTFFYKPFFTLLSLFSVLTTWKITRLTYILHVLVLFLIGFLCVRDSMESVYRMYGEVIILMGLLLGRVYGVFDKKTNVFYFLFLGAAVSVKFYTIAQFKEITSEDIIPYLILMGFINFFFFKILNSAEEKQKQEARLICSRWQKEQVYTDIGKNVFSSFIHDYNISDSYAGLQSVRNKIKQKQLEKADEMVQLVMEMLVEDETRIHSVRSRVILSERDKPEPVNLASYINTVLDKIKMSKPHIHKDICFINNIKEPVMISIVPIDLIGILENILKNSIEATEVNKLSRQISLKISPQGKKINLSIKNNGPKIKWTQKDGTVRLSDFRPGNTTKKEGTGWGMYATINRVESNGAEIQITSNSEETEFSIIFPPWKGK